MSSDNTPILVQNDPWLAPFAQDINDRQERLATRKKEIKKKYGSVKKFASGYEFFGFNYDAKAQGWWYREWAPNANELSLIGDFNDWDRKANVMAQNADGIWEVFLDDKTYADKLVHESAVKVHIVSDKGESD